MGPLLEPELSLLFVLFQYLKLVVLLRANAVALGDAIVPQRYHHIDELLRCCVSHAPRASGQVSFDTFNLLFQESLIAQNKEGLGFFVVASSLFCRIVTYSFGFLSNN
jgi:hypothetical protein